MPPGSNGTAATHALPRNGAPSSRGGTVRLARTADGSDANANTAASSAPASCGGRLRLKAWLFVVLSFFAVHGHAAAVAAPPPSITTDRDVYLVVTKPHDRVGRAVVRGLYPASVYLVCPPDNLPYAVVFLKMLQRRVEVGQRLRRRVQRVWRGLSRPADGKDGSDADVAATGPCDGFSHYGVAPFDPFGTAGDVRASARACLDYVEYHERLRLRLVGRRRRRLRDGKDQDDGPPARSTIRGVLLNQYGSVGDGSPGPETGLLALAEYKLVSPAVFIDVVLERMEEEQRQAWRRRRRTWGVLQRPPPVAGCSYSAAMRFIAVGTEAARGLPRMGFAVPTLGTTRASLRGALTGSMFSPSPRSRPFRWEDAYAHLRAVAARGLPKMEFAVPTLGTTRAVLLGALPGSTFGTVPTRPASPTPASSSPSPPPRPYRWEDAYSHVSAVGVLYMKALAASASASTAPTSRPQGGDDDGGTDLPRCYFGVVSPGMTTESLRPRHVPREARTVPLRLRLLAFRRVLFPILRSMEIAKPAEEGGRILVAALTNGAVPPDKGRRWRWRRRRTRDGDGKAGPTAAPSPAGVVPRPRCWDAAYPSGSFVGARSGTGGPICDQEELEGGRVFGDEAMQRMAYDVVQEYVQ